MKLLLSLHDVTPHHMARLIRAERLLTSVGVERVTYLYVPNYHGACPAEASPEFVAWSHAARPFDVQWFLHGYYHAEGIDRSETSAVGWRGRLARAWMTAGEGEFLGLSGVALRSRLERGVESFLACLGVSPSGFVAPAWLHNDDLMPALRGMGFKYSETHARIFQLQTGRARWSPVVTWATRTVARKYGSLVVAPALARHAGRQPIMRVALHPTDMDHPMTVRSIARVLERTRRARATALYDDALFE
jgi:hypothetical protein